VASEDTSPPVLHTSCATSCRTTFRRRSRTYMRVDWAHARVACYARHARRARRWHLDARRVLPFAVRIAPAYCCKRAPPRHAYAPAPYPYTFTATPMPLLLHRTYTDVRTARCTLSLPTPHTTTVRGGRRRVGRTDLFHRLAYQFHHVTSYRLYCASLSRTFLAFTRCSAHQVRCTTCCAVPACCHCCSFSPAALTPPTPHQPPSGP